METFDSFDFDTMTETTAANEPLHVDLREDVSFVRGLLFGLLFTLPCWLAIAGVIVAAL